MLQRKMDSKTLVQYGAVFGMGLLAGSFLLNCKQHDEQRDNDPKVLEVVLKFLEAQSDRDLDLMCDLVSDDVVYVNEPHPPERDIRGKEMFRYAFEGSPCIWCPEANLQILQHSQNGDTVFVERLDQFKVDDIWLKIPILGYLKVRNGKVVYWKDYWDYSKYKKFTVENYGPDFSLFKRTKK